MSQKKVVSVPGWASRQGAEGPVGMGRRGGGRDRLRHLNTLYRGCSYPTKNTWGSFTAKLTIDVNLRV